MNKGYAFGFFLVLLVLVLGSYVAYTGFVSSRDAIRALPTQPPSTEVSEAARPTVTPSPTLIPTVMVITPTVAITPTTGITLPVDLPTATVAAEQPAATQPPPEPTEPLPTVTLPPQPPSVAPAPTYPFRLASPPKADSAYPNCCYLVGTVRDAAGNGLEGVQVQALNEWNTLPPAPTKGGAESGQYNIPIGHDVVGWDLVVLDASGNPISPKVQIQFDPSVANAFRVDWQRTY